MQKNLTKAGVACKPERLKENLSGFWSRRIDDTHRLIYTKIGEGVGI